MIELVNQSILQFKLLYVLCIHVLPPRLTSQGDLYMKEKLSYLLA